MQERYLFRGKTIRGDWKHGLLANKDDKWYISNKAGRPFAFEIRPESICQSTGLKDKNGNFIWENDIIKHYNSSAHPERHSTSVVLWDTDNLRFCKKNIPFMDGDRIYNMASGCVYEVIGNTFDNPELLEGSHDRK